MIGASADADNVAFIIGFSAGGVLIATLIGLYIKARMDKRNGGEK